MPSALRSRQDTSERYLVNIDQDHASASGAVALRIKQDAASDAVFIDHNSTTTGSAINLCARENYVPFVGQTEAAWRFAQLLAVLQTSADSSGLTEGGKPNDCEHARTEYRKLVGAAFDSWDAPNIDR